MAPFSRSWARTMAMKKSYMSLLETFYLPLLETASIDLGLINNQISSDSHAKIIILAVKKIDRCYYSLYCLLVRGCSFGDEEKTCG
jgi:hypothetical protein